MSVIGSIKSGAFTIGAKTALKLMTTVSEDRWMRIVHPIIARQSMPEAAIMLDLMLRRLHRGFPVLSKSVKEKFVQNKDIPAGAQEVLQEGKPGYVVETYQIKKVNGETVGKKRVSRDTYRPQSRLIAVNNGSAEAGSDSQGSKEQIVEDGISGPNF